MPTPGDTEHAPAPEHSPFRAHQYASAKDQFRAAKLGMWLFLGTEILMFSGLFCAYAVYRQRHPEVFVRAAEFLNWKLGMLNTLVLICSSMSMAWAVYAARCNQQRRLRVMLAVTMVLAFCFLGIKGIEYADKWREHLLPGTHFHPEELHAQQQADTKSAAPKAEPKSEAKTPATKTETVEPWTGPKPGAVPQGMASQHRATPAPPGKLPNYTHIFFGIYFMMTGLHGLHVLGGIAIIWWMFRRAGRGEFGSAYYTPVDLVGLYWHFVDMIWIYLFPLLYLIR